MITYEKILKEFEVYEACYKKIDALYWNNVMYTDDGRTYFQPQTIEELKEAYHFYRKEISSTLTLISEYSKRKFKLHDDEISNLKSDMEDYEERVTIMFKHIL